MTPAWWLTHHANTILKYSYVYFCMSPFQDEQEKEMLSWGGRRINDEGGGGNWSTLSVWRGIEGDGSEKAAWAGTGHRKSSSSCWGLQSESFTGSSGLLPPADSPVSAQKTKHRVAQKLLKPLLYISGSVNSVVKWRKHSPGIQRSGLSYWSLSA